MYSTVLIAVQNSLFLGNSALGGILVHHKDNKLPTWKGHPDSQGLVLTLHNEI